MSEKENIWGSVQKEQVCPKDGSTLYALEEDAPMICPICGYPFEDKK